MVLFLKITIYTQLKCISHTRYTVISCMYILRLTCWKLQELAKQNNFDKLHTLIENAKVTGVGKLANYDIALRISWYLHSVEKVNNILPKKVYLHSGTRDGAKKLMDKGILKVSNLRKPLEKENLEIFGELKPYQIEDFLCVCKGCFGDKNGRSKCCPKNCGC